MHAASKGVVELYVCSCVLSYVPLIRGTVCIQDSDILSRLFWNCCMSYCFDTVRGVSSSFKEFGF